MPHAADSECVWRAGGVIRVRYPKARYAADVQEAIKTGWWGLFPPSFATCWLSMKK